MEENKENKGVILIVEDEPFLRELCLKKIVSLGYEVETAADGEDALKKVEALHPKLVLLDLVIPGTDGFGVLEQIRSSSDKEVKDIPVMVLSNLGQQSDIDKAVSLGANDYLIKSNFTIAEIIEKAEKFL